MESSATNTANDTVNSQSNFEDDELDMDLLGFSTDSTFEKETRTELEDLVMLEKDDYKLPEEPIPKLLTFNPSALKNIVDDFSTGGIQSNKYLRKALLGKPIDRLQSLVKWFNPSLSKEDDNYIIVEISGNTGKLVIDKNKILSSLQKQQPKDQIQEEKSEDIEDSEGKDEPQEEAHEHKGFVSMDWDKINEEHKVENRSDFDRKVVDKICQFWQIEMGCEANDAMIHKWVVDKGYAGPNAQPDFLVAFYNRAVNEIQSQVIGKISLKCIIL